MPRDDNARGSWPNVTLDGLLSDAPLPEVPEGPGARALPQEQPGRYDGDDPFPPPLLGRGGMGRVLSVPDRLLGRRVALKLLDASPSAASVQRFLREACVTAQLDHPGIVAVHDLGTREDGTLYYTMREVRGRTLAAAIDKAPLAERLPHVRHFVDLCHAVEFAHSRGVIHRDIKPDNVMVGPFGETVLLDWGLAKLRDVADVAGGGASGPGTGLTLAGAIVGTPKYMSPEQATGGDVDERSDQFCLGHVLAEIAEGGPADLLAVAEKARAPRAADRYADVAALRLDVERWMAGAPVTAYAYGRLDRLARLLARHRRTAIGVGVAGGLVLAAVTVSAVEITAERDRAVAAERLAEDRETKAMQSLAEALSDKATAAIAAGDRLAAELYAAGALVAHERPDARGRIVMLARSWRPRLARSWPAPGGCRRVRWSADGGRIACGSATEVRVWDRSGKEVWTAPGGYTTSLAFDADGGRLAQGDREGGVRVWDAVTGAKVWEEVVAPNAVNGLAFDRDALVVGGMTTEAGDPLAWGVDATTGRKRRHLDGLPGVVYGLAVAPDGRVALGVGTEVGVWRDGRLVTHFGEIVSGALGLAWSPDGAHLAVGAGSSDVQVWDPTGPTLLGRLRGHAGIVPDVTYSPDGRRLASGSDDGLVLVRDLASGLPLARLPGHEGWSATAAFSPDGAELVTGGKSAPVRVWALPATPPGAERRHTRSDVVGLTWGHGGTLYASDGDGRIYAWADADTEGTDRDGGPVAQRLLLADPRGDAVWYDANGTLEHTGADLVVAERVPCLADHTALFAVAQEGDAIGEITATGEFRRLPVDGGAATQARLERPGIPVAMAGRHDGWDVAVADGRLLRLARDGSQVSDRTAGDGRVTAAAWAGDVAAVGFEDGRVVLRDRALGGHAAAIAALAFSPDGRLLASGGLDRTARIWDVGTGDELARIDTSDRATAVAFSPDGGTLAVGGWDASILLAGLDDLRTAPGPLLARLEAAAGLRLEGVRIVAR